MSAITYNTEVVAKLKTAKAALEAVSPIIKKGVENSVEIAEESNSEKYIASAHSMAEAVPVLADKTIPELVDAIGKLITYYEKLAEAL